MPTDSNFTVNLEGMGAFAVDKRINQIRSFLEANAEFRCLKLAYVTLVSKCKIRK